MIASKTAPILIKLCIILLIVIMPLSLSAQYYQNLFVSVENLSNLTEAQLDLALTKSLKTIETGKMLTYAGGVGTLIGGIIYFVGLNAITNGDFSDLSTNTNIALAGGAVAYVGITAASIGIPIWLIGDKRKDNIEIALVKFKPLSYNDRSGLGIGLNVLF
jgi:hypothetical protein